MGKTYEVEMDDSTIDLITKAVDVLDESHVLGRDRTIESDIRRMAQLGASCILDKTEKG